MCVLWGGVRGGVAMGQRQQLQTNKKLGDACFVLVPNDAHENHSNFWCTCQCLWYFYFKAVTDCSKINNLSLIFQKRPSAHVFHFLLLFGDEAVPNRSKPHVYITLRLEGCFFTLFLKVESISYHPIPNVVGSIVAQGGSDNSSYTGKTGINAIASSLWSCGRKLGKGAKRSLSWERNPSSTEI